MSLSPDIYEHIIAAKGYIDEHFQEPIRLHQISRQACFSRFHFHRLFTRIYLTTPHQYLTKIRIEKAAGLLQDPALCAPDVCYMVGYESMGSFSGLFKKEKGIGPADYRKQAIRRLQETREHPKRYIPGCFLQSFTGNNSNI